MSGHGEKFERKMEEAVAALLLHPNVAEAARAVGIGASTLLRWLKEPEFQAAYREARHEAVRQSVSRLQQGTSAAADTLLDLMTDKEVPPSVRVRAAEAIFNHSAKAIELEDIESRVAALEAGEEGGKR